MLRVANGFKYDWMPSGYRDVKINSIVEGHLCEVQLHLHAFHQLKDGQHEVYEWARDLNVTTEMRPEDLFKNMSHDLITEMIGMAQDNWHDTASVLPFLQVAAGQYVEAEENFTQVRVWLC